MPKSADQKPVKRPGYTMFNGKPVKARPQAPEEAQK